MYNVKLNEEELNNNILFLSYLRTVFVYIFFTDYSSHLVQGFGKSKLFLISRNVEQDVINKLSLFLVFNCQTKVNESSDLESSMFDSPE